MHCPVLLAGCRGADGSSAGCERRPAGTVGRGPGCGTAPRQGKGWVGPGWMGQGSDCEFTAYKLTRSAPARQPRLKSCRIPLTHTQTKFVSPYLTLTPPTQGKAKCGHLCPDRFCLRCAEAHTRKQATAVDVSSSLANAAAGVTRIAGSAFPDLPARCI